MDSCSHPSQAAAAENASSAAQMPPPPPPPPQICTKAVATAPPAGAAAAGAATAYHHHQQQYYGHGQFGGAVVPDGFGLPQVKGQRGGVGGGSNFDHGQFGGAVLPDEFRYPHATGQSGGYGPGPGHYDQQQQGGPSQQQGSGVGYQKNQGEHGGGYSRGPGGRHNSHCTTQLSTITNVSGGAHINRQMEAERENQLEQRLRTMEATLGHVKQQQTTSSAAVASAVSAVHDGQQRTTQLSTITNVSGGEPVNRQMEAEHRNQLEQELCQLKARLGHVEQQQTVMGERVVEEVGELHRQYDALDDQVGELKARATALQKYWNVKANKDAVADAENTVAALTLTTDEADKTELKSILQDGLAVHHLGKADMSIRNAMRKEVLSRTELDPSLCAKSLEELHGALAAQNLEQAKCILNDQTISLYDLLLLDDCLKGGAEQRSRGNFLGGENKEMNFLIAVLVPFARLSFWSTESEDTEQADASFALFQVLLDKLKLDCTVRNKGKFFQSQLRYCMLAAAKLGDAQLLVHLASFKMKTDYSYANASVDTVVGGKTTPLKQAQDMESLLAGDRTAMLTGLRAMGLVETGEDLASIDLDRLKQRNKAAITFLKKLGTNRMVTSVQEALDTRGATYSNKSQLTTAAKKAAKKLLRDLGKEPGALPKIEIMGVDESDPKAIKAIPGLEKKIRTMLAAAEKNPHALNNQCVKVQLLRNPDAPTQGGYGLCAAKYLKAGSLIMIYAGKVYCRSKDDEGQYDHSAYIFKSGDGQFDIDAEKLGNEASFINGPCESLGEKANVKFLEAYVDGFPYCFIYVMNSIQKNKPILADYGAGYWSVYTSSSTQQDMNDMAGEIDDLERILNKK